ncbi:MAG: hypothetical protein J6Y62_06380 [Clostridia bacterium]|nr:hypothetical protein [Clostridia bacterium]
MKLSERVAYLKGLADGLKLDEKKSETKLITGILEILEEVADAIDLNKQDLVEMTERVDEIDMDLGDLEAILFEGFEVEELTEEDFADLEEGDEDAFSVVYTTDEEPVEEEADDEAVFAAADEVVAEAEAAEAEVEEAVEEVVEEEVVVEEPEESVFEEVVETAAPAAAAAAVAEEVLEEPEEEEVVVEEPEEEVVEEVVEREAEPEEDTYEVECPTCGHIMYVDDSVLAKGGIECPKCHEKLEFEIEYED